MASISPTPFYDGFRGKRGGADGVIYSTGRAMTRRNAENRPTFRGISRTLLREVAALITVEIKTAKGADANARIDEISPNRKGQAKNGKNNINLLQRSPPIIIQTKAVKKIIPTERPRQKKRS